MLHEYGHSTTCRQLRIMELPMCRSRVLVTSRRSEVSALPPQVVRAYRVERLGDDDAKKLLCESLDESSGSNPRCRLLFSEQNLSDPARQSCCPPPTRSLASMLALNTPAPQPHGNTCSPCHVCHWLAGVLMHEKGCMRAAISSA